MVVGLITLLAVSAGWWHGAFFQIPFMVALAIDLLVSIALYVLRLGLYRWLPRRTRHAYVIYVAVELLFIPVDPIQMSRGQFEMGGGHTVCIDALVGQVVMLSPVVFYEFFRGRMSRVKFRDT